MVWGSYFESFTNQLTFDKLKYKAKNSVSQQLFEQTNKDKQRELEIKMKIASYDNTIKKLQVLKSKPNRQLKFFDWKLEFSEIMNPAITGEKCGFDIVIGNPPYVKEYTNRDAFEGIKYYQGKMDLWYSFACCGIDYLKKHGVLTFIATNNWVTNAGASIMRDKVISDSQILKMVDFGSNMIFESASIQTMIMMFKQDGSIDNYNFDNRKLIGVSGKLKDAINLLNRIQTDKTLFLNPIIKKAELKNKFLLFGEASFEAVLDKINSKRNFVLDEHDEVAQGIVTPQDFLNKAGAELLNDSIPKGTGIFTLTKSEKQNLNANDDEKQLIKPLYSTEQLGKYYGERKNKQFIIYTDSRFKKTSEIKPYPNFKNHLDRFRKIITSDNHPYGLHRARDEKFFLGEKIISVRKCAEPTFTFTDFDCYVLQTFFVIKSDRLNQKFLTGLLNSKLVAFWLRHRGKMQGGQYQVDKAPLLEIPICSPSNPEQIIERVKKIIDRKAEQKDTSKLEKEIDLMVYKLYLLTYDEVLVVDKEFEKEMSREEYEKKDFGFEYVEPQQVSEPSVAYGKKKGRSKNFDFLKDLDF